jgi:three-Cys-motif partner protein
MAKDINKDKFPEETKLKLEIFAECFREWFPVFVHNLFVDKVFIYDFFAGSGKDTEGTFGSPLILLNEAKGENCKYCDSVVKNHKRIFFMFNEKQLSKEKELEDNIRKFMEDCKASNCKSEQCVYDYANFNRLEFKEVFQNPKFQSVLANKRYAKFILLDQYGFSQIDEDVFKKLVNAPTTDFIFFISSSFIRRFKTHPATKQYFDTTKINFDDTKPKECHRLIAQYYREIVPQDKEYYLHHFTIRKGSNYWGLIFGTNHSLGMEKFLKICWKKDKRSGEASFNINDDYQMGTLFYNEQETVKKQAVELEIKAKILSKEISDNITGLKYALKRGCLPVLFTNVIKELEKNERITRNGELNYSSTNIHNAKLYNIVLS